VHDVAPGLENVFAGHCKHDAELGLELYVPLGQLLHAPFWR
jgi:hypothetical protein